MQYYNLISFLKPFICDNSVFVSSCHEAGASSLIHATQHQILISAGKKGLVNVWDIRQARLLHAFKAHDSAVKTMCLDAGETMFATGDISFNKFEFRSLTYLKTLELDSLIPSAKYLYLLSTL